MNIPNITVPETYKTELFFELSADLLCIAGFDGYFKKVNHSVPLLLRYSEEELFSRPIDTFIHEEDRIITSRTRDNIKKNMPLLNFENRYITKSGEIVWISWTSMPFEKEQLIYGIGRNITHLKKIEEERNFLLSNLKKINKDLKQITYTASHDLRSPVNNLLSVFSLLDVSKIEDEETLQFIEIIKSATFGLQQTLNDYVDTISHNEKVNLKVENLYFKNSLESVLQSIKALIKDSKARFEIDFSEMETVMFNKTYLESIFLNLITNSIKYANPDALPVISITTKNNNDVSQLIFSDNGQGIDLEKVRDKIFGLHQKFNTNTDSKGIGLYLVYNYITDMGGQIDIESELNVGTTFTINFKA